MLVTLKEILAAAEKGGNYYDAAGGEKYAVGHFNMLNLEMARGIIAAAEAQRSPLILGVAEVHFPFIPFEYAAPIMVQIAREATVPVCLTLDHGTRYDCLCAAMKAGFSSVMFDGSALPYEENIARTAEAAKVARALGVSVEAELGHVGQGAAGDGQDASLYTRVEQVNDFITRSGADALAIAIGTAHGAYKAKPKLDIGRLDEIYAISKAPLVLHGGSGLTDEDFRTAIAHGIRKVNICTDMCVAEKNAQLEGYAQGLSFEETVPLAVAAVQRVVEEKMRLFGSAGKA